jgi:hypothetical protein
MEKNLYDIEAGDVLALDKPLGSVWQYGADGTIYVSKQADIEVGKYYTVSEIVSAEWKYCDPNKPQKGEFFSIILRFAETGDKVFHIDAELAYYEGTWRIVDESVAYQHVIPTDNEVSLQWVKRLDSEIQYGVA